MVSRAIHDVCGHYPAYLGGETSHPLLPLQEHETWAVAGAMVAFDADTHMSSPKEGGNVARFSEDERVAAWQVWGFVSFGITFVMERQVGFDSDGGDGHSDEKGVAVVGCVV